MLLYRRQSPGFFVPDFFFLLLLVFYCYNIVIRTTPGTQTVQHWCFHTNLKCNLISENPINLILKAGNLHHLQKSHRAHMKFSLLIPFSVSPNIFPDAVVPHQLLLLYLKEQHKNISSSVIPEPLCQGSVLYLETSFLLLLLLLFYFLGGAIFKWQFFFFF